jgi:hypothetical protein
LPQFESAPLGKTIERGLAKYFLLHLDDGRADRIRYMASLAWPDAPDQEHAISTLTLHDEPASFSGPATIR